MGNASILHLVEPQQQLRNGLTPGRLHLAETFRHGNEIRSRGLSMIISQVGRSSNDICLAGDALLMLLYQLARNTKKSVKSTPEVAIAGLRHRCSVGVLKCDSDISIERLIREHSSQKSVWTIIRVHRDGRATQIPSSLDCRRGHRRSSDRYIASQDIVCRKDRCPVV